ncbi:hypothetical protein KJ840_05840 [Patescibacteria group bacterium]|nr:hypothetical protein [Patescibacteria group bacterium]
MSRRILTKAEKRQKLQEKAKNAPKGAKFSGQIQKMKTSKNYAKKKRGG